MDLSKIYKNYKLDIIAIAIISVIFVIASCLLWGYFGSVLYDCGREAYLPQLLLEGKILFKDIFGMYNPLSYQINALLYLIFGINTNVLYFAGTINAFLTLLCLYFIFRQFVNEKYSASFILFIMTGVIFNSHVCTNNIFPYAFAMAYATTAMLYSALLGLLYLKKQKSIYIILSFLLLGISLANKPEFGFCIIPLIGLLIYKKEGWITYLLSVISFLLPTIISYGIMYLQGFTAQDFMNYMTFVHNFFDTKEQQFYNMRIYGINNLIYVIFDFCVFSFLIVILPILFSELLKRSKLFIILPIILLILLSGILVKLFSSSLIYLSWTCIVCFFVLYQAIKNKNISLAYISIFAILSCYRLHFILTCGYSCYMGLLPLSVCLIYLYLNSIDKYVKRTIAISLILFGAVAYGVNFYVKHGEYINIRSLDKQNILYDHKKYTIPFNDTIDWVLENTNPEDTVLVLPEGLFINYITKRPTNPKYYHLIPNHISALGEDNIVEDLNKNLPDYVVLNNTSYIAYGAEYICKDFGFKICRLVDDNYSLVQTFISPKYKKNNNHVPYIIKIFKLKNKS